MVVLSIFQYTIITLQAWKRAWCIMWPIDLWTSQVYPWDVSAEEQENVSISVKNWYVVSYTTQVRGV